MPAPGWWTMIATAFDLQLVAYCWHALSVDRFLRVSPIILKVRPISLNQWLHVGVFLSLAIPAIGPLVKVSGRI